MDDIILQNCIDSLNAEANVINIKRSELRNLLEIANSIKLVAITTTTNGTTTTTHDLPKDPKLGVTIEISRRNAIYDKLLLDIVKLIPDYVIPDDTAEDSIAEEESG